MNQKESSLLWLGTVVNTHGIKGEVRVLSNSDDPTSRFKVGTSLKYFSDEIIKEIIIETMRPHKQFILLTFKGFDNINQIEWTKGMKIYCDKSINDDEYYLSELIGKEVINQSGEVIGISISLINQGAYESLIVKLNNGNSTNIPIVDEFEVKLKDGQVTVNIPEEFIN